MRGARGFYVVDPEVAGAIVSGAAPCEVCIFDTWLGDDLVRAHPLLLMTTPVMKEFRALHEPSGFKVVRARVRGSEFFRGHSAKKRLPTFWQLQPTGLPGEDDVAVTGGGSLVVSQRVLELLMQFRIGRAVFAQYKRGVRAHFAKNPDAANPRISDRS